MKLENLSLQRLTVHKIYGKSKTNATPYADACNEISKLGADGMETLLKRIDSCLNHKSKFYELDLVDTSESSFFEIHKELYGARVPKFLSISQLIADKAAESHSNANIPDGLLLVIEAKISGFSSIICVKAEKSNAFSLAGNDIQLIKDIFLSSDKTLYKVGFFVKRDSSGSDRKAYKYYVYDDAFSPSKGDLAHYFYSSFLGLTTDKNGKLLTNNLYRALTNFAQDNIDIGDKFDLIKNIDRAFLDKNRKNINATDFKSFFPDDLDQLYESVIEQDFPNSFIKDNSIITTIETKRIALTSEAILLLKNAPDGIITGSTRTQDGIRKLRASIDSGNNFNYALIPSNNIIDKTRDTNEAPKRKKK